MPEPKRGIVMLMADDDEDDRVMVKTACKELKLSIDLRFVGDGADLMDYLARQTGDQGAAKGPRPELILLDLNLPRKNGHQALKEIRSDNSFKHVPIIVFSSSKSEEDIAEAYALGADAFVSKPATFDAMRKIIKTIHDFLIESSEPGNLSPHVK